MDITDIKRKMIAAIGILAAVFIAASAVYYRSAECLPFVYGTLLGSAVSVLKVIMLARAVGKSLSQDTQAAANHVRLNHLLRMFISGAVLVLAALVDAISLWGAAAGVLSFQLALYVLKATSKNAAAKTSITPQAPPADTQALDPQAPTEKNQTSIEDAQALGAETQNSNTGGDEH